VVVLGDRELLAQIHRRAAVVEPDGVDFAAHPRTPYDTTMRSTEANAKIVSQAD
jgi:hypothetical protein